MKLRIVLALVLGWILSGDGAEGATRTVPGDHSRITDALSAAANGDTILVGPGTYSSSVNGEVFPLVINKDAVHLQGAGMFHSVIDAEGQGTAIRSFNPGSRITGFTVTNAAGVFGGGIAVVATDTEIDHNLILQNTAEQNGAGIFLSAGSSPWIHHNVVWENTAGAEEDPHSINAFRATGIVEHNVVGRGDGNGIFFGAGSNLTVRNNILFENGGRGMCALGDSIHTFEIAHNLFWQNTVAALLIREPGGPINRSAAEANDYDPADAIYGNIDADPMFVAEFAHDWHLRYGSPAIDGGDPGFPLDPDGTIADIGAFFFSQTVGISELPRARVRLRAYPNPFRGSTVFTVESRDREQIDVEVFDVRGRRMAVLARGLARSGPASLRWDGKDGLGRGARPGVYFVRASNKTGQGLQLLKLLRLP